MTFLTAHWKNLIMVNFEVQPELLQPYVPARTELDFYEGKCYVSLVTFLFDKTRLLGISIPFHKTFEEVNLRFYVKRREDGVWKRGVVFVKEIVPRIMISAVANVVYGEHYECMSMSHDVLLKDTELDLEYQWSAYKMKAKVDHTLKFLVKDSIEEFIAEHYWGYTKLSNGKTGEYEVVHEPWKTYELKSYALVCDFKSLYGPTFEILNGMRPASVLVAQGSMVEVKKRKIVKH